MTVETRTPYRTEPDAPDPVRPVDAATTGIIVNGRRHVVAGRTIDRAALVALSFPASNADSFTVAYRDGSTERPAGFVVPGQSVTLSEDQVFHVAAAVQS